MRFQSDRSVLFSRGESDDPRLGDLVRMPSAEEFSKLRWDAAIIGFPDDRGVALNKGRAGAKNGPNAIRKWLYRLVPPTRNSAIADLGDMAMTEDLHHDHEQAVGAVMFGLSHAKRVLILGGGHDWGFAPIKALMSGGRTGFVNLDAHLDVRASREEHSGTSYWRALESGVRGEDAVWIGVQRASLASAHEEYVYAKGGQIFFSETQLRAEIGGMMQALGKVCHSVDLSLDMDVFCMSHAPGVSAPQPGGMSAADGLALIREALLHPFVRTFGIYELAPDLDENEKTARLAARCAWEALR
jgi:formiminoglutamase